MSEHATVDPHNELIGDGHTYGTITDKITEIVLTEPKKTPLAWIAVTSITGLGVLMLLGTITYLVCTGIGIWGNNIPVGWAFDIINFVWWIGIGHAGTLISAILLLMRQEWRTSINRFAEAMTIFAVMCAGLFPLLHTGRPWLAFWLLPYPNTMSLWPQFRSPLIFDVFAVSTYATVSLLFWYMGMIPDLATLRDRAKNKIVKVVYGMLSMGWRGAARHWERYETATILLAGLSTPLVLSVHSVVSFDFSVGIVPGWHTTVFPPYFVAGAVFAGFAMVLTLAIPIRAFYGLKDFITDKHLENMGKVMLATGLIVAYGYAVEAFMAWYSGSPYEAFVTFNRLHGPYRHLYWSLMLFNIALPQLMWIKSCRRSIFWLYFVAMSVNVGMWLERFVIIVQSLHRDFLPSAWHMYSPTIFDWTMFTGTIALFLFMFFQFIRFLPMIAIFEMRLLVPRSGVTGKGGPPPAILRKTGDHSGESARPAGVGSGGAH
jgi:molybdopterin-containing oxidoreductase family membrane subunit